MRAMFIQLMTLLLDGLKKKGLLADHHAPFVMSDGSILIADDKANVIYRVTNQG